MVHLSCAAFTKRNDPQNIKTMNALLFIINLLINLENLRFKVNLKKLKLQFEFKKFLLVKRNLQ